MKNIVWGVVIAHAVLVAGCLLHHLFAKPSMTRMVVRTVHAPPQKTNVNSFKTAEKPLLKKTLKEKPVSKVVKKPNATTPLPKQEVYAALETMQKELSLLDSPATPAKPALTLPSAPLLESVSQEPIASYGDLLLNVLQNSLILPDVGHVTVELQIDPKKGKVLKTTIVDAQSEKNKEFLQKELPEMILPCFNEGGHEVFVCTILFKNL